MTSPTTIKLYNSTIFDYNAEGMTRSVRSQQDERQIIIFIEPVGTLITFVLFDESSNLMFR